MSTTHATTRAVRVPAQRQALARSPQRRDVFIDVIRVLAVFAVVAQHWIMPTLAFKDGDLRAGNAFAEPGAWAITWLSQVMPLIFFAGGAAAAMAIRRRQQTGNFAPFSWASNRIVRLAWPVIPLAAVWLPLPHILASLGLDAALLDRGASIVGQLLWFLAVYVLLAALTPALSRVHHACRGAEIAALAAAAIAVDVVRFGWFDGAAVVGYANVFFVWAAVHQVGIAYGFGHLTWVKRPAAWTLAAVGFAATAFIVTSGPYVPSMIGMPGEPMSNMNPPTAVLLSLAVGQIGLALALKPGLERWARGTEIADALDKVLPRLMTVYLWHMPALVVVTAIAVIGLGFETPDPFGAEWREAMPMWFAALAAALATFTTAFGRFEHPPKHGPIFRRPRHLPHAVIVSTVLIGLGMLVLTIVGFQRHSIAPVAVAAIGLGIALLRPDLLPGSFSIPQIRKA